MDAITLLTTRGSTPWRDLVAPGPDDAEIAELLAAAMATPEHGAIRPWRFIVISGDSRAAFGEVLAAAILQRKPDTDAETLEKDRVRLRQVPLLIVVAAEIMENHPKVPPVEQIVSAGMAAQGLLLAAQARGYGGVILTGDHAYDANVKRALGLADKDQIVGFLYIGTGPADARPKKRPDPARFTRQWTGPRGA